MHFYKITLLLLVLFQFGVTVMFVRQQSALQAMESAQQRLQASFEEQSQRYDATILNADARANDCAGTIMGGSCVDGDSISRSADVASTSPDSAEEAIVLDDNSDWLSNMRESIMQQLIPFGFTAYDSERIVDIELAALQEFRAIEKSEGAQSRQRAHTLMWQTMDRFREELGEFGYEAYLDAKGLPMRVKVRNVAKRSQAAGLEMRAGDEIERYNGERVYDIYRLNQLVREQSMTQGNVSLVFRRGEATFSRDVTSGPIGIHALPVKPNQFFDAFSG